MKYNRAKQFILLLIGALFFSGCSKYKSINIKLSDPGRLIAREQEHGNLPAASPEHCHNALLRAFSEDTEHGFLRTIEYTNTFRKEWPQHRYMSSNAYLGGWAVMFLDVYSEVNRHKDIYSWDEYLAALLVASSLFELSSRQDSTHDSFWTSTSGDPMSLIHEGFYNPEALGLYLEAKRITQVRYHRTTDKMDLVHAIRLMEQIQQMHPEWARFNHVDRDRQETVNAMVLHERRKQEAAEIFDN